MHPDPHITGAPAPDDLSCQELVELITAYLDGALEPAERARFEAHLSVCPPCRDYLGQFQRTVAAVAPPPRPNDVGPDRPSACIEIPR